MLDTQLELSLRIWEHNQNLFLKTLNAYSEEDLNRIPEGFNNNLIWNIGHVLATRMLLTYGLSGQQIPIDAYWIDHFRKGTKPEALVSADRIEELKSIFQSSLEQIKKDLGTPGFFKDYKSYTTSTHFTLDGIEQAIAFAGFHDGVHLGSVLALRKLI